MRARGMVMCARLMWLLMFLNLGAAASLPCLFLHLSVGSRHNAKSRVCRLEANGFLDVEGLVALAASEGIVDADPRLAAGRWLTESIVRDAADGIGPPYIALLLTNSVLFGVAARLMSSGKKATSSVR